MREIGIFKKKNYVPSNTSFKMVTERGNGFYCDIDIKKLVESENKIYILSNEINEELEKIVSKSI